MTYIVLVAGKGAKLQPLTLNHPKTLYKLDDNTTVLQRLVRSIREYDLEAEIVVVVGYMYKHVQKELEDDNVIFIHNPFYSVTSSMGSMWFAKDYLQRENVTIINGDIVMSDALMKDVVCKHTDSPYVVIDSSHKAVDKYNVQVIGVPDEGLGEEIMACIILKEGAEATEEEINDKPTKVKRHICEKCDLRVKKDFNPVLIDLRILQYGSFEGEDQKVGFLPKMIMIPQEELKLDDFPQIITDRFTPDKGNFHFIFLTSSTGYFNKFESNLYEERQLSQKEKEKMKYQIQTKIDKELKTDKVKDIIKNKDIYRLKEYDNLKNTLDSLLQNNFPYVSFVIGGYEAVHEKTKELQLSLLNHFEDECQFCKNEKHRNKKGFIKAVKSIFHSSKHKGEDIKRSFDYQRYNMIDEKEYNKGRKREKSRYQSIEQLNALWTHEVKVEFKHIEEKIKDPKNSIMTAKLLELNDKFISEARRDIFILIIHKESMLYLYSMTKKPTEEGNSKLKELGYGKHTPQKDPDLTLEEKIFIPNILSKVLDEENKSIINIRYKRTHVEEKSKDKDKSKSEGTIILDMSTGNESAKLIQFIDDITKTAKKSK